MNNALSGQVTAFGATRGRRAHWRGRFRVAVTGVAFCAALVVAAMPAGAGSLAQKTMDICMQAQAPDQALAAKLSEIGWQEASTSASPEFRRLFRDGVAAATGSDLTSAGKWQEAVDQADSLGEMLFIARSGGADFLLMLSGAGASDPTGTGKGAALAVLLEPPEQKVFRCFYAGEIDAPTAGLLETIARMDASAGITPSFPGIQIAQIDNTGAGVITSVRIARFLPEFAQKIGRSAQVEMGFSLFRAPER